MGKLIAVACAGAVFLSACDRPECKNTNPIFEQHAYDSRPYLEELIKEIAKRDPKDLSYWMHTWEIRDYKRHMVVHVQGDGLCAKAFLTYPDDETAERPKKRNYTSAGGARGAEIIGLRFELMDGDTAPVLLFKGYDDMID
jgi:hypothetical protein